MSARTILVLGSRTHSNSGTILVLEHTVILVLEHTVTLGVPISVLEHTPASLCITSYV